MRRLLRRLEGPTGDNRISEILERSDPAAAARWRDATSDAGRYLLEKTKWGHSVSSLLEREAEIKAALDGDGYWEIDYEWRIMTPGSERIEKRGRKYFVRATCHGVFAAEFEEFATAVEASQVFSSIQKDLFYAVGWSSWAGWGQYESTDPAPTTRPSERERYLLRLSEEAEGRFRPRLDQVRSNLEEQGRWEDNGIQIRPGTWVGWDKQEKLRFEVTVESPGLAMSCTSPTVERATEFAGIFQTLQADMRRILDWLS